MENDVIPPDKLDFIAQVQKQIDVCRRVLSRNSGEIPHLFVINTLESLLWAKLVKDDGYKKAINKIDSKKLDDYQISKLKFRAIMVFIDKKNLIPMGDKDGL